MTFALGGVATDAFSATPTFADGVARLALTGTADAAAVAALSGLMSRFHAEVVAARGREVIVDLHACDFMNSACFKSLVVWLGALRDAPSAQQYRVRFVSNPAMHWQRRSLHALSCFASELVTVET